MHKYLKMATSYANSHSYHSNIDYHLSAVIVKGGKPISVGYNKHNTNAFVEHYTDIARGNGRDFCLSTHAEMDAVLKIRGKIDLRGTKIFVSRIKKIGGVGMARPCHICQHVLYNYGIRKAYYTIDDNTFGVMRIINPAKSYNEIITNNSDEIFNSYDDSKNED